MSFSQTGDLRRPEARAGSLLKERLREGIELAKKAGVYKGRKRALTLERVTELRKRIKAGDKKAAVAREFGISRETLYSYL